MWSYLLEPYKARCGRICSSTLLSPLEKNEHALGLVARLCLIPKIPETSHFWPKSPLTFRPVGQICPNTDLIRTVASVEHFMVTYNSHNSSKKIRSARGPCPNLDPTFISPIGYFVRPALNLWDQNVPNLSDLASKIYGNYQGSSSPLQSISFQVLLR